MATRTLIGTPQPDDLSCDGCPGRYPFRGTLRETQDAARVVGWHIFDGSSVTGRTINKILCPSCVDKGQPVRRLVKDMQGQLEMFPSIAYTVIKKAGDKT